MRGLLVAVVFALQFPVRKASSHLLPKPRKPKIPMLTAQCTRRMRKMNPPLP
jgi:hypothetical protein